MQVHVVVVHVKCMFREIYFFVVSLFSALVSIASSIYLFLFFLVFVAMACLFTTVKTRSVHATWFLKIMFMYANIGTTLRACLRERRTREQDSVKCSWPSFD